jgi:Flp pilus assembly protein TadG
VTGRLDRVDDGGTATAELVVLTVVFFAFIAAIVFAGRMTVGSAQVEAAARSAARTISIARDPEGSFADAEDQAQDIAGYGSAICTEMAFTPHVLRPSDPDETGTVEVDIACTVDLSEISLIAVPGAITIDASAVEVLDRYREEP